VLISFEDDSAAYGFASSSISRMPSSARDGEALYPHLPFWQLVPAGQIVPQSPQLASSLSTSVQPTPGQQR
jgi:hypothetical protein